MSRTDAAVADGPQRGGGTVLASLDSPVLIGEGPSAPGAEIVPHPGAEFDPPGAKPCTACDGDRGGPVPPDGRWGDCTRCAGTGEEPRT